ncbi:hypothetical protein L596_014237 [Steinernema carpocapsae]|uniref:Uncharacterized protein n=1 Tax=Steinernema carpocapsae TaxID=34508 RepID=A0A4U5NB95_STECR|nr:hypothetical protein L596_014237 [Steinernema carpocapsae]
MRCVAFNPRLGFFGSPSTCIANHLCLEPLKRLRLIEIPRLNPLHPRIATSWLPILISLTRELRYPWKRCPSG